VSCTSEAACTAVGSWIKPGTGKGVTLAEIWDGTAWAIQPTPTRPGRRAAAWRAYRARRTRRAPPSGPPSPPAPTAS
jgi:hypothetical protein